MSLYITKTPLRVSFFGGGTDFPEFFLKKKSIIIGTAINQYIYINQLYKNNLLKYKYNFFYSISQRCNDHSKIKHPVFKKYFQLNKEINDIEIHINSDLPSNSGLGSSSAFVVGFLNLMKNKFYKKVNKRKLSDDAISFERNQLNETVGFQDQIFSSFGNIRAIQFDKNNYKFLNLENKKKLKSIIYQNLFLVNTNIYRSASNIEKIKIRKYTKNFSVYDDINRISHEALKYLNKNDKINDFFGKLLHETWMQKKKLDSNISNNYIDNLYQNLLDNGASGGKLLGAGSGGYLLIYVENHQLDKFKKVFNGHINGLSVSTLGSKLFQI